MTGYEHKCKDCGVEWSGEYAPDCDLGLGGSCIPESRVGRREEAIEAAFRKIWTDIVYTKPGEMTTELKPKIRVRLERMADFLVPDDDEGDERWEEKQR